jgi:transcriptional regulator with XRE-family HTH domain
MTSTARMLRSARLRAGLSQRALAERSGIPQPSIARMEAGQTVPRVDTLQRLLRATGHELDTQPRLGEGVDRSLIRALLALTPDERGRGAVAAAHNLAALRASARIR